MEIDKRKINDLVKENTSVIHGHYSIDKFSGMFSEAKRITFIRNPVYRIISHFNHSRFNNTNFFEEKKISIIDFARIERCRNMYKKMFKIKETDFYFIGCIDNFLEDIHVIEEIINKPLLVGFNNPDKKYMNVSSDIIREIIKLNMDDVLWYIEYSKKRGIEDSLSKYL